MAEAEQTFMNNPEHLTCALPDSDEQDLTVDEFDQQNITGDMQNEYNFPEVVENQSFIGHEQGFTGNEPENKFETISEQNYSEIENEQTLDGEQPHQDLEGVDFQQEYPENEANEVDNSPDDIHVDKKEDPENNLVGGLEVKKWPGWPGNSVFRIVVPGQKVGNIMGRKGEFIKKIVEETRARIKVMSGSPGSKERAVLISAKEEPDASVPPAIDGLLRVYRRMVDGLDGDSSQAPPAGAKVSIKFLVPATQAGILIGKQGATVKSIQETSSCIVRVLGQEHRPVFALQDDRVIEVVGEPENVHKAIELIASHLRKFLVDRSIIPIFEEQMQAQSAPMEHMPVHPGQWGPPQGLHMYGHGPQYMPPPPAQFDNYYPPADMPPPLDRQPPQGMSTHASYYAQSAPPSMSSQMTQQMQIPLQYADAVIGPNGSVISYVRRTSGATVTIQETKGVSGEMTAEISGTAFQVQTAQQLIMNYMASAAATTAATSTAAAPTQTDGAGEQVYSQGYSSFPAPAAPVYGSPTSTGTQPATYGSVYGTNYGY